MAKNEQPTQGPDNQKGRWITTREGRKVFIEEKKFKKYAIRAGLGTVAAALTYVVGKRINLFTRATLGAFDLRRWGTVIRNSWRGRKVLGKFIKANGKESQTSFKHQITQFVPSDKGKYLFRSKMSYSSKPVGSMEMLLNARKKTLTVKSLKIDGFDNYKKGLGKAFRNPYEFAVENGYKELRFHVSQGEQGLVLPLRTGVTWAEKTTEHRMKREAIYHFDDYLKKLEPTERALFAPHRDRIIKHISKAKHPAYIAAADTSWSLPLAVETKYFQEAGPYIMSRIKSWNGTINLKHDPSDLSYRTFRNFVGVYTKEPLPPHMDNWVNRVSKHLFKDLDPKTRTPRATSVKKPVTTATSEYEKQAAIDKEKKINWDKIHKSREADRLDEVRKQKEYADLAAEQTKKDLAAVERKDKERRALKLLKKAAKATKDAQKKIETASDAGVKKIQEMSPEDLQKKMAVLKKEMEKSYEEGKRVLY